ncbi:MAG: hypothetical protein JKY50_02750 [Oleispira sp.]|nr:hypothetical protein [Oleispira sp.]MBL4880029.1 hypothetical protein [Oleispira sp.]
MPVIIPLLLKFFWFGIMLIGPANAWFIQKRARPLIEESPALQADANKVSMTLILMIGIPSAMLGIIQLLAGYESPFYIFDDDLTNPYLLAAWIILVALRIFILYWLWFTKGLESYLAVTPIRIKKPQFLNNIAGILMVRWLVTGILATWFISVVVSFL